MPLPKNTRGYRAWAKVPNGWKTSEGQLLAACIASSFWTGWVAAGCAVGVGLFALGRSLFKKSLIRQIEKGML